MSFFILYKLESRSRFFTKKPYISCFQLKMLAIFYTVEILLQKLDQLCTRMCSIDWERVEFSFQ
jgi:hypothetical protein